MAAFKKLVRFLTNGRAYYGELLETKNDKYVVQRFDGCPFEKLVPTDEFYTVDTLLQPIESTPLIICIGLNYRAHAKEANVRPIHHEEQKRYTNPHRHQIVPPTYPPVFTKPADALAGPFEGIPIHPDAQSFLDYEGELTVVIGKDALNVSEELALDYVLGYTAGNDVSARNFQVPEASGGQYCYAKSFDKFGPIGHNIVSAEQIPDPQALCLRTRVNGVVKQETSTGDMIFGVQKIISHLSRGTTLRKGTVIMTGTPSGVGYFRKEPLQDGDIVEVEIEGVATVRNQMKYL
ncbi:MhpD [Aspergillus parasiticus SU-1]|uniref:MhpD n=1 Tax=Aspergillus parasiticus (strain ATCC 56775 / NRRL 5862 / SRRC 143 / SU-1) TaxID=1403190 RepID=A0A0F0I1G1_ASPPU|nr:MhpD [Aspergillus parasiticus SU-1]